jgi:phosphatidylinositol-3-phosphatase
VKVRVLVAILAAIAVLAAGLTWYFSSGRTRIVTLPNWAMSAADLSPKPVALPHPAHVVVIVEENKSFAQIIGNVREAPYLNELAARGAVFTRSYGVAHPSQPNYFALFAGRTNSDGDGCAVIGIPPDVDNLGAELLRSKRSFVGYAEDLPRPGFRGCVAGNYVRKHAPWMHFTNIPDASIQPFTALGGDWNRLPTLAFIIPNILNDMHSASIRRGDTWLRTKVGPLVTWAAHHDTLIVITWDESSSALTNHIPTIFIGPMVAPGRYDEPITHYRVLRTLEDLYGLPHAGSAAGVAPIDAVWRPPVVSGRSGSSPESRRR